MIIKLVLTVSRLYDIMYTALRNRLNIVILAVYRSFAFAKLSGVMYTALRNRLNIIILAVYRSFALAVYGVKKSDKFDIIIFKYTINYLKRGLCKYGHS